MNTPQPTGFRLANIPLWLLWLATLVFCPAGLIFALIGFASGDEPSRRIAVQLLACMALSAVLYALVWIGLTAYWVHFFREPVPSLNVFLF